MCFVISFDECYSVYQCFKNLCSDRFIPVFAFCKPSYPLSVMMDVDTRSISSCVLFTGSEPHHFPICPGWIFMRC